MTCVVSTATFASLQSQWEALAERQTHASIFLTPLWQRAWWDSFGPGRELRLLPIGGEAAPSAIAPMMLSGDTLAFLGGSDLFDYHDVILSDDADAWDEVARCILAEEWKHLELLSLRDGSHTLEALPERLSRAGCEVSIEQEGVSPGIALPSTWDDYLASLRKKDRHELRRKLRRLDTAGPWRVVAATPQSLDEDIALFLELMRVSSDEKRIFMAPEREAFFRTILRRTSEAGYLRLKFLEVGGERVSGVVCFDYAGRRHLYNSGYRLDYGALSVGLLLKVLTLREAIEQGLTYYDLLRGAEPYKHHLGARDVALYTLRASR